MAKKAAQPKRDFSQEFNLLNKKLNLLLEKQNNPKKTWVKVGVIQELTGWNAKWLTKARQNNLVESRKNERGFYDYCLESIHPSFIRKKPK